MSVAEHHPRSANVAVAAETRFWEKINLIAEIAAACRRLAPEAPAFEEVLGLIQVIIPFDAASLYVLDRGNGRYVLKGSVSEEVVAPEALVTRDQDHPESWRPLSDRPQLWSSSKARSQVQLEPGGFASILVVPLCLDDEIIGVINLGACAEGVLAEKQIKLISVVADQMAVSLDRLEYVARIEARHHVLQQSHKQLRADQARLVANEKLNAVAELAAAINHQINNPLSIIVGNVECLALEETRLKPQSKDRLKRIVEATLKVGEVNRRLLRIQTLLDEADLMSGLYHDAVRSTSS